MAHSINVLEKVYNGSWIQLDLSGQRFKRRSDKEWHHLPTPNYVALTHVSMRQSAGGRAARISHKYKAFCVYIKVGDLNILAFRGKSDEVLNEGKKIARFLNIEVKDLIPRNPDGTIEDDDAGSLSGVSWSLIFVLILILLGFLLSTS